MSVLRSCRLARAILVTSTAVALSASAPSARPPYEPITPIERREVRPTIIFRTVDDGFSWESAAIGAGGTVLLLLSANGAVRPTRHHSLRAIR